MSSSFLLAVPHFPQTSRRAENTRQSTAACTFPLMVLQWAQLDVLCVKLGEWKKKINHAGDYWCTLKTGDPVRAQAILVDIFIRTKKPYLGL